VVIVFFGYTQCLQRMRKDFLQDRRSGANVRIRELTMEGRMVKYSKSLYSRREGVSEETDSRERVEDMLKEERELTKLNASKLDIGSNAV